MKTTLEIPDGVFRRVKSTAALQGQTLKDFITEAVTEKLKKAGKKAAERGWRPLFGAFKKESGAIRRVQKVIDEEFSKINLEDWK